MLGSADFGRTTFGHLLAIKLGAVTAMIAVSSVHDFVHGPAAGRVAAEAAAAATR